MSDSSPHSWYQGLLVAIKNWYNAGYPDPRAHINKPLVRGQSLAEMLMEDPIDQQKVDFAGRRLRNRLQSSSNTQNEEE